MVPSQVQALRNPTWQRLSGDPPPAPFPYLMADTGW